MHHSLSSVRAQIMGCTKCRLHSGITHYVPGYGSDQAQILFVGEGPGKQEDIQGKPFVGASGKFLDTMLASISLKREDVFITNIVKCRPPDNRDPREDEIETCLPYLEKQIEALSPKLIITLGRYSMNYFLPNVKISEVHGKAKKRASDGRIILPLYHPAVALYNGSMREVLLKDFAHIPKLLSLISSPPTP
jgi:DNA polymerase